MSQPSLFRRLLTAVQRGCRARAASGRRRRLRLEPLEDRTLLSGNTIVETPILPVLPGGLVTTGDIIGDDGPNDVDLFGLNLQAGDAVSFDIEARKPNLPGNLDGVLRLFRADGTPLAFNDDAVDPTTGVYGPDPFLQYTVATSGRYYVGVSGSGNFAYDPNVAGSGSNGSTGAYELMISLSRPGSLPPSSDVGDTLASAQPVALVPGQRTTLTEIVGNNSYGNSDVDLYRVTLHAGDRLSANINAREINLPGGLDSVLRAFNAAGTELALNDDATDPDTGVFSADSALRFAAPADGDYYVGVSSYGNNQYNPTIAFSGRGGSTGEYRLLLDVTPAPTGPGPGDPGSGGRPEQVVWLDFDGGSAANGWPLAQSVPRFEAGDVGVAAGDRDRLIAKVFDLVREDYITSGYFEDPATPLQLPVQITTTRPESGPYMTVFIGGQHPTRSLFGIAEGVDEGNRILDDNAAVYSQYIGSALPDNATFDQRALALADTISHEMGHNFGLAHVREDGYLMQAGEIDVDQTDDERFGTRGTLYHTTGEQNDVAILRRNLRLVPADQTGGSSSGGDGTISVGDGATITESGTLSASGAGRSYAVDVHGGDVLQLDLDGRELGLDPTTRFTLTLLDAANNAVASNRFGIDPETGYTGDPYLEYAIPADAAAGPYTVVVSADFGAGSSSNDLAGSYELRLGRRSPDLPGQPAPDNGFAISGKVLTVNRGQPELRFSDADGDTLSVQLVSGDADVQVRLVGGVEDHGDVDSIVVRNASASALIVVQRLGGGASTIGAITVIGSDTGRVVTRGVDVNRYLVNGPVERLRVIDGTIRDTLSINGVAGDVLTDAVQGLVYLAGDAGLVRIGSVAPGGSVEAAGTVQQAEIGTLGGAFQADGSLLSLDVAGTTTGSITVGGDAPSIRLGGTFGAFDPTQPDLPPGTIRVQGRLGDVNVRGDLLGGVFGNDGINSVVVAGVLGAPITSNGTIGLIQSNGTAGGSGGATADGMNPFGCNCPACRAALARLNLLVAQPRDQVAINPLPPSGASTAAASTPAASPSTLTASSRIDRGPDQLHRDPGSGVIFVTEPAADSAARPAVQEEAESSDRADSDKLRRSSADLGLAPESVTTHDGLPDAGSATGREHEAAEGVGPDALLSALDEVFRSEEF